MSTPCAIVEKQRLAPGYRAVNCHFDGYVEGVGAMLTEHWCDSDKVSELLDLGELSCLGTGIDEGTVAYHRDRGEEYQAPVTGSSVRGATRSLDHGGNIYVWAGDRWTYNGVFIAGKPKSEPSDDSPGKKWLVVGHDYTTGAEDNIWSEEVHETTNEKAMKLAQTDRCAQFDCGEEDQVPRFAVEL